MTPAATLELTDEKTEALPVTYTPETVLTFGQVLRWLQISEATAARIGLRDKLPYVPLGCRTKRYVVKQVLEWMDREAGV